METFEYNPEEYIRQDIEGSDVESRRRSASELVKVLSSNFPDAVCEIFGASVQVIRECFNVLIEIVCCYYLFILA